VSNLNEQVPKGLNLKAPDGKTWFIEVAKNADELLFMSGWDNFAKANELQENDPSSSHAVSTAPLMSRSLMPVAARKCLVSSPVKRVLVCTSTSMA